MNNAALELLNGSWTIILLWVTVFLVDHLKHAYVRHDLRLRDLLFALPESMQLGFAVLVLTICSEIVRGTVWYWRLSTGGTAAFTPIQNVALALGGIVGTVGFLCVLRLTSRDRHGNWPWIAALASAAVYCATVPLFGVNP